MHTILAAVLLAVTPAPVHSQEEYGAKGVYPVYEASGQWLIFDKNPKKSRSRSADPLAAGSRFMVIGSQGADIFHVARASATYGGACRKSRPVKLRTALLKGPRKNVGAPIIGIKVPPGFSLAGSRAEYLALKNQVSESVYAKLGEALKAATAQDVQSGAFKFEGEAPGGTDQSQTKIDFVSHLAVKGARDAFVLVEGTQVSSSFRRCLRLADGDQLVGGCSPMPHALMAETGLLRFVSYDPNGGGNPYLLAYTSAQPLWGDERWGFVIRKSGPRLFLSDAMDIRCREGF